MDSDDLLLTAVAGVRPGDDSSRVLHLDRRAGRRRLPEPPATWTSSSLRAGRSGLKERLVDFAEQRARERGMDFVDVPGRQGHRGCSFFAGAATCGTTPPGSSVSTPRRRSPAGTLPEGYAVRPFTMADAEPTYRVIVAAFGEWDDGPAQSFAVWRAANLRSRDVDPSAFRVATFADEVIGAASCSTPPARPGWPISRSTGLIGTAAWPSNCWPTRTPPPGSAACPTPG